jgi:hypothetical protein
MSKNIQIVKNNQIVKNKKKSNYTLNLNQTFFDPTKSSPPNEFMIKLYIRMNTYTPPPIIVNNLDKE